MVLSDEEKHVRAVGALIVNLQSLEFLLRGFLSTVYDSDAKGLIPGMPPNLTTLHVGQSVPENYITNYDNLVQLIEKYNAFLTKKDISLLLDKQLVTLRDALAHGRVFQEQSRTKFQLLKFDRPANGQVQVVFSETMDDQWFKHNAGFIRAECNKVYDACRRFAPTMIV